MAKIKSDNNVVKNLLESLVALVCEAGGYVHPRVVFSCKNGEMTLKADKSVKSGDRLIFVPVQCMPTVEDFEISFDGETVASAPREEKAVSSLQVQVMETMLGLYNETDKINEYSQNAAAVQFQNQRQIIEQLKRSSSISFPIFDMPADDINQLKLQAFLESRWFLAGESEKHRLLPLIDFADHHSHAKGFVDHKNAMGDFNALELCYSPMPKSNQCYAKYRYKDKLASVFQYGFIDESVPFLQSIPLKVEVPEVGSLQIKSGLIENYILSIDRIQVPLPGFEFSIPEHAFFSSSVYWPQPEMMEVNFYLVPRGRSIGSLREAIGLHLLLWEVKRQVDRGSFCSEKNIELIESAVINGNREFYLELRELAVDLKETPFVKMFRRVLEYQLAHLSNYTKKVLR